MRNILSFICCCRCKGELKKDDNFLICPNCQIRYEVKQNIPVMIGSKRLNRHHRQQIDCFGEEIRTFRLSHLTPWQESYLGRFRNNIPISDGSVVLDVGTESGYMAIELARAGYTVLACDLNLDALLRLQEIAQRLRLTQNLFLFACLAEELPVKTGAVDIFICNSLLEHVTKETEAIDEIGRVCREKAWGFVTTPPKLKYIWPFFWVFNIVNDKRIGHLRRYDRKDLEKKFKKYGFRIEKCFYTGHFLKTIGVLAQIILRTHRFDRILENIDERQEEISYGAHNLITVWRRKG